MRRWEINGLEDYDQKLLHSNERYSNNAMNKQETSRYVVARHCHEGIGAHVSCLLGAWWYAKQTARTLVIDWRGSRYNSDPSGRHNCFYDFFKRVDQLDGVPTIADDTVATLPHSSPFYPTKWTTANLRNSDHVKHSHEEVDAVNRLVNSGQDRPESTVAFNQGINLPPTEAARALFKQLQFSEKITSVSQNFWNEHVGISPAIGIHVRHGNGENIDTRAAYWLSPLALARQLLLNNSVSIHRAGISGRFSDNMPPSLIGTVGQERFERRFCQRIVCEFKKMARHPSLKGSRAILLTDSPRVVRTVKEFLPDLVTLPKLLLGDGAGPLHQVHSVVETANNALQSGTLLGDTIANEMFIELDLLRRCKGLICMASGFSLLTRLELDEANVVKLRPTRINRLVLRLMRYLPKAK